RHLARIGAAGYRQVLYIDGQRIDRLFAGDLDPIDEPAHSPRPGGVLPRIAGAVADARAELGIKLVERVLGMVDHAEKRVLRDIVMEEVDGRDPQTRKNTGGKTAVIGDSG